MSAHSGPNIVEDGLVLCLDAANPECFESGQTTCTNLITGGLVTGASGTPSSGSHTPNSANFPAYNSINGGVFDFNGGKGMNCDEDLGNHSELSISMWFYKNSGDTQYITDGRNDGGLWFLSNYSGENINWYEDLRYNFSASYNASHPDLINNWIHMVAVGDSSESLLYLNGYEITVHPKFYNSYFTNYVLANRNLGKNYRIGTRYTTSSQWTGYMGHIAFYNKKLSATEANENFNALRGRYGI